MSMLVRLVVSFTRKHPISRGMGAYALLWPASNITQQLLQGRESIDWWEAFRFSLWGTGFVAPSIYAWVRISGILIPGTSLNVAILKVNFRIVWRNVYFYFRVNYSDVTRHWWSKCCMHQLQ